MIAFSENLKRLRESHKIKKSDMAKLLNISPTAYAMYETGFKTAGDREPTFQNLVKIAEFFKVSTDELLNHTIDEFEHCIQLWRSAGFSVEVEKMPLEYFKEYFSQSENILESEYKKGEMLKIVIGKLKNSGLFIEDKEVGSATDTIMFVNKKQFIQATKELEFRIKAKSSAYFKDFIELVYSYPTIITRGELHADKFQI